MYLIMEEGRVELSKWFIIIDFIFEIIKDEFMLKVYFVLFMLIEELK